MTQTEEHSPLLEAEPRDFQKFGSKINCTEDIPAHILDFIFQFFGQDEAKAALIATSQVCKSWHQASSSDSLWEPFAKQIHKARYRPNPSLWNLFHSGPETKNQRYIDIHRIELKISTPEERDGPKQNYKQFYIHTMKNVHKEYDRLEKLEKQRMVDYSFVKDYHLQAWKPRILGFFLILLIGCLFFLMPIIKEAIKSLPAWTWSLFFIPVYLIFLVAAIMLTLELTVARKAKRLDDLFGTRFRVEDTIVTLSALTAATVLIGCFFVLLITNISFLEKKDLPEDYIFRRHVIPWHAVFAPLLVLFTPLALLSIWNFIHLCKKHIEETGQVNIPSLLKGNRGFHLYASCFCLSMSSFIILLGFALEFPKHIPVAVAFIPVFLMASIIILITVFFAVIELQSCRLRRRLALTRRNAVDGPLLCLFGGMIAFGLLIIAVGVVASAVPYPWGPCIASILTGVLWFMSIVFSAFLALH